MHPKIKQMVLRMQAKEKAHRRKPILKSTWFLYILRCNDGSFYTGVTNDIKRRFKMHNSGQASRYTRTRRPVELLYQETCGSRTQALVRECFIKAYPRKKKAELIAAGARSTGRKRKGVKNAELVHPHY